ncbi:unnamed protein product [Brugia timori]|uniref:Uncharacterized protein n=1 Tax=Brugia timori TaxID=42155 RepID=A0A0R3RCX9_9BILA|nr:unnamed protein product [Brugia timori]
MNKLGILLTKLRIQLIGRSSPSSNSNNLESSAVDPMPYTLSFGAFKIIFSRLKILSLCALILIIISPSAFALFLITIWSQH